jgi:hypothetical protein
MSIPVRETAVRLTEINDRLDALADELASLPTWRKGTTWHTERTDERHRLLRERDELRKPNGRSWSRSVATRPIPRYEKV